MMNTTNLMGLVGNVPQPWVLWALLVVGILLFAVLWEATKPVKYEPEDGTVSNEWRRDHAYRDGQKGSDL